MKSTALSLAFLLAAGTLGAQELKVTAVVDTWYTQMLDHSLRLNTPDATATKYYPMNAAFKENGFALRRSELWLKGKVTDEVSFTIMFDPSAATTSGLVTGNNPNLLNDAYLDWKLQEGLTLRVGQFKPFQTYEAINLGTASFLFYDRSMLARQFGDKRDRGAALTYAFGQAKGFNAKVTLGVSNGSTDLDGGKANDLNAQKDLFARFEAGYGADHKFGAYCRSGSTHAADKGALTAAPFAGTGAATPAMVLDNKDRTTNLGAFYAYDTARWHGSVEAITGKVGRRFPSMGLATAATPALREHLDQTFFGATLSGAVKVGRHWFTARYDLLNMNQGDDFYGATSPYLKATGDFSPKYTEAIVGYNYLFNPVKYVSGKMKVNLIHRSDNFLTPRAGETGAQGGDSLVVSFQFGF